MQETPRNKLLGIVADALASTYSPRRTQQMQGIAKLFGLPAMATTADRLSYGEPLTSGKGMTTKLKPETQDTLLALLETLPTPGKAVPLAAGVIGPAMAFGAKRSEIKLAEQLIAAGKADEAYKQFKIYSDPTTDQLLKVIPDTDAAFAPGGIVTSVAPGHFGPALPTSANLPQAQYQSKIPLSSLLLHPQLYKASPDTANVQVGKSVGQGFNVSFPDTNEAAHVAPGYLSPGGDIALGQTIASSSVNNNPVQQLLSNLLHETQHNIQYWYDMPQGGAPKQFMANPARVASARAAVSKLDKNKYATGWAEKVLKDVENKAFSNYELIPGEVQARLVQKQFETGDYTTHPYELMRAMGVNPEALRPGYMAGQLVDLNPTVQDILRTYAP